MFSVLISIYSKENPLHFHICMESVCVNQSLKPTEIILVEDGPLTEGLYQEISYWKVKLGDTLKIIKLDQNVGVGIAKNIGLEVCKYEIVCIVDTDDILVLHRFEKQVEFLLKHPEIAVCGGQILEFEFDPKNPKKSRNVPLYNEQLYSFAKRRSPFNNMTIAYRKSIVQQVGGYQHHLWMEDYNLFLRIIANGYQLYNFDDILVYARIDNGMHKRRRGLQYIESEKQLLTLKIKLKIQNPIQAYLLFFVRAVVRVLPDNILERFYSIFLRN